MSGLIAGVVGGFVVTIFSGSELSVSGPAAGLAVIVLQAIQSLGAYETFLVAVVIAGLLQIVLGIVKAGSVGDYVPNSVIRGMLSGIGVMIILKQIPHAVGWDFLAEGDEVSFSLHPDGPFGAVISALSSITPGPAIIGVTCLLLLILWDGPFIKGKKFSLYLPGPLVAVLFGTLLNELFLLISSPMAIQFSTSTSSHLVRIPSGVSLVEMIQLPDFSQLFRSDVIIVALTIAIVASIETLLSVEAVDKLDPLKRISNTNRELKAQGIGNMVSGLLGGLPITAVIVRSSTAVYAGGKTRMTGFSHGILLLFAVMAIPFLINHIPLSCLAAVLIHVGYKLTSFKVFKKVWKEGFTQFIPFIITIVAIVMTDLLIGIGIGLLAGIFFVMRSNHHAAVTLVNEGAFWLMRFNKDMTFVNKAEVKRKLRQVPDNTELIVNGSKSLIIDHDIHELINEFSFGARFRGIKVELIDMKK